MLENMKVGKKIGLGFSIIILLMVVLGSLSIYNMSEVKQEASILNSEYIPEVLISTDLRGAANRIMYDMNNYLFTSNDENYQNSLKELDLIDEAIKAGEELDQRAEHLKALGDQLVKIKTNREEYYQLMLDLKEKNKNLEESISTMNSSANIYIESSSTFLDSQNKQMDQEIKNNASASELIERKNKITWINDVIDLGNDTRIMNFKAQALRDPNLIQEGLENFKNIYLKIDDIKKITRKEVDLIELDYIKEGAQTYESSMKEYLKIWTEREKISKDSEVEGQELIDASKVTAKAALDSTERISNETVNILDTSSRVLLIGTIIVLLLGVVISIIIVRTLTIPILNLVSIIEKGVNGDLSVRSENNSKDEIGELAGYFNQFIDRIEIMIKNIKEVVMDISTGTDDLENASNQIARGGQDLAEASSQQAASIQETSANLDETTSLINTTTDNVKEASNLSDSAQSAAQKGNEQMQEMLGAMSEIKESSDEISKIIKTIDDIAFQTNILALNAAVEAGRAGDAGSGFAVVAEEVRNLAARSAEAAKDTTKMIEKSVQRSTNGMEIAEEVNESLEEIQKKNKDVNAIMDEISIASEEQAKGIEEINTAIGELEEAVQSISATSEESAASSEELNAQLANMNDIVKRLARLANNEENSQNNSYDLNNKTEIRTENKKNINQLREVRKNPEDIIPLTSDD